MESTIEVPIITPVVIPRERVAKNLRLTLSLLSLFKKFRVFISELIKIMPIEVEITSCGEIFGNIKYKIGTAIIPPPTPKSEDRSPTKMPVVGRRK